MEILRGRAAPGRFRVRPFAAMLQDVADYSVTVMVTSRSPTDDDTVTTAVPALSALAPGL